MRWAVVTNTLQTPVPAGVAGAVAVVGPASQAGPLSGGPGGAAGHRLASMNRNASGRPRPARPARPGHVQQRPGSVVPLAVAGLAGQVGEHPTQAAVKRSQRACEGQSSITCATAKKTNWASVSRWAVLADDVRAAGSGHPTRTVRSGGGRGQQSRTPSQPPNLFDQAERRRVRNRSSRATARVRTNIGKGVDPPAQHVRQPPSLCVSWETRSQRLTGAAQPTTTPRQTKGRSSLA